ncbi:hypothetical protein BT67DRAFT_476141 [Trichocladium antarcticum]|uniref:Uncharacterized protein n=1 Tax=Trichocladium antarcticum TaxID=1450529 RepID=A0AAN6USK5_9PEZI|nr:hypothetical protein BT67DRAFT_476141 [Trichocladium antarcticum]
MAVSFTTRLTVSIKYRRIILVCPRSFSPTQHCNLVSRSTQPPIHHSTAQTGTGLTTTSGFKMCSEIFRIFYCHMVSHGFVGFQKVAEMKIGCNCGVITKVCADPCRDAIYAAICTQCLEAAWEVDGAIGSGFTQGLADVDEGLQAAGDLPLTLSLESWKPDFFHSAFPDSLVATNGELQHVGDLAIPHHPENRDPDFWNLASKGLADGDEEFQDTKELAPITPTPESWDPAFSDPPCLGEVSEGRGFTPTPEDWARWESDYCLPNPVQCEAVCRGMDLDQMIEQDFEQLLQQTTQGISYEPDPEAEDEAEDSGFFEESDMSDDESMADDMVIDKAMDMAVVGNHVQASEGLLLVSRKSLPVLCTWQTCIPQRAGIGCGQVASLFNHGSHATTFGPNPVAHKMFLEYRVN